MKIKIKMTNNDQYEMDLENCNSIHEVNAVFEASKILLDYKQGLLLNLSAVSSVEVVEYDD